VRKLVRFWRPAALALLVTIGVVAGIYYYLRPQFVTAAQLLSLLPKSDAVVFYADLKVLRETGVLKSLDGSKSTQEPDYQHFVADTGFSYSRDLDAVAVASVPNQLFAVLRGHFDWTRLSNYAKQQGGTCQNAYCQLPGTKPGRWISFFPIRSDVMGMAVSPDPTAAYTLLPRRGVPVTEPPAYPAWVQVPKRVLDDPHDLSPALQVFARALASAEDVTFGITGAPENPAEVYLVRLVAQCASDPEASGIRDHLSQLTRLLQSLNDRQPKQQPPADDLAQILVAGKFRTENHNAVGEWHIPRSFFDSLLNSTASN
jgi:hypothetical protein